MSSSQPDVLLHPPGCCGERRVGACGASLAGLGIWSLLLASGGALRARPRRRHPGYARSRPGGLGGLPRAARDRHGGRVVHEANHARGAAVGVWYGGPRRVGRGPRRTVTGRRCAGEDTWTATTSPESTTAVPNVMAQNVVEGCRSFIRSRYHPRTGMGELLGIDSAHPLRVLCLCGCKAAPWSSRTQVVRWAHQPPPSGEGGGFDSPSSRPRHQLAVVEKFKVDLDDKTSPGQRRLIGRRPRRRSRTRCGVDELPVQIADLDDHVPGAEKRSQATHHQIDRSRKPDLFGIPTVLAGTWVALDPVTTAQHGPGVVD